MSANGLEFLPSATDIVRFAPETILVVMGTFLMVLDGLVPKARSVFGHISLFTMAGAIAAAVYANGFPGTSYSDMLLVDSFATFFRILVLIVGMLAVLASYRFLSRESADRGEYHALILFSVMGQCVMASANELIMIFIGLEISSIATYVLAGYLRDDKRANEASLKYFLLGSFATAFFLYGVAVTYGLTGTTNLTLVRKALLSTAPPAPALVGLAAALMFVGLAFKVSSAPFQIWAPDVYQGAPTPVTLFMSTGPKVAAFAIFLRIFMTALEPIASGWEPVVWLCALLSMTIGNFAALSQTNIKRMMAYSAIANAGYVMVALAAHSEIGTSAAMFYLAAYAFMNVGVLVVIAHVSGKGEKHLSIEDFAGLGAKEPLTAALLTVFLLSLIGVPLTGGFFGKFYIFRAALQSNLIWLTILGLLNSAVAAFYYLRILVVMYMRDASPVMSSLEQPGMGTRLAMVLAAFATFILGIFPAAVLAFVDKSAALIR